MRKRAASSFGYTLSMLAAASAHRSLAGAGGQAVFDAYVHRWAGGILHRAGCRILDGDDPPSQGIAPRRWYPTVQSSARPRMVVANHRSSLDIPVLLRCFGGSLLSKAEVRQWPLIGIAAERAATVFVDRSNPRSGVRAIRAIRDTLLQTRCLSVFPEGTTFAGDEVREFAPGCFAALRGLDAEVTPVGLAHPEGSEFLSERFVDHARDLGQRAHTFIAVSIGTPMRAQGTPSELAEHFRIAVQAEVHRARALLDANLAQQQRGSTGD